MNSIPIQIQLPKFQVARVWINALPLVAVSGNSSLTKSIENGEATSYIVNSAAIEWLVPLGPRIAYGLLGGRFIPSEQAPLVLDVVTSTSDAGQYSETLASKVSEDARIGLPMEYGKVVFNAAADALSRSRHPLSGQIIIDHAVHGLVGSSPVMFERLASALIQIIGSDVAPERSTIERILVWR